MISESGSILCASFLFCEGTKILDVLSTYWSIKPKNLWWQKKSKKIPHVLEDSASGVQVGHIEQVII